MSDRGFHRAINVDSVTVNLARAVQPIGSTFIITDFGVYLGVGNRRAAAHPAPRRLLVTVQTRPRARPAATHFLDGSSYVPATCRRLMLLLFIITACAIHTTEPAGDTRPGSPSTNSSDTLAG